MAAGISERIRGRKWMQIRREVLTEEPLCRICSAKGKVTASVEVDHIIPLHKGGKDERENYQGLCGDHHKDKSVRESGKKRRVAFDASGHPIGHHHWNR